MRDLEPGLAHDGVAEQDQIQVECAGCAFEWPGATVLRLDGQQQIEQLSRRERGLTDQDSVEIEGLRLQSLAFGFSLDEIGKKWRREVWGERIGCKGNRGAAIAHVAAKRNDGAGR